MKNIIEAYSLQATQRSYKAIIRTVQETHGHSAHLKHPALVSTLLRFQEEMIRSTTEAITTGTIDPEHFCKIMESDQ